MKPSFILASSSKERALLLKEIGCSFSVIASLADEWQDSKACPQKLVTFNAELKAKVVAKSRPESLVLGVDTIVYANQKVLAKPTSLEEGIQMFNDYQQGPISVFSALALSYKNESVSSVDKSIIYLREYDKQSYQILFERLFDTTKAGGFSIKGLGALLFDSIEGSFYNILGLPLHTLDKLLNHFSFYLWDFCGEKN